MRTTLLTPELASNKVIKTLETVLGQIRQERIRMIRSPNLSRGFLEDLEHAVAGLIDGHDLAEAL